MSKCSKPRLLKHQFESHQHPKTCHHPLLASTKESAMTLIRCCSTCFLVYAFLSCFYTTSFLLLCPFVRDCSTSFALDISKFYSGFLWTRRLLGDALTSSPSSHDDVPIQTTQMIVLQKAASYRDMDSFLSDLEVLSTDSILYWASLSQSETSRGAQMLGGVSSTEQNWAPNSHAMSELLFLSKAFSGSMHPMRIFPYFYKASETFDDDDVTITTLVTPNRFEVLRKLAARYEGTSVVLDWQ